MCHGFPQHVAHAHVPAVFILVPVGIVRALSTAPIALGDEDDEDEDGLAETVVVTAAAGGGAGAGTAAKGENKGEGCL
jgi:hypothetical protein